MPWTPEGRAYALENYGILSASQIAKTVQTEYGCAGITRNAVIGIAARAGKSVPVARLEQSRKLRKMAEDRARKNAKVQASTGHARSFRGVYVPEHEREQRPKGIIVEYQTRALPQVPIEEPLNVDLMDLRDGQCKAITGADPKHGGAWFCGHAVAPGRSWCAGHASRFHCLPTKPQKKAIYVPAAPKAEKATPVTLKQAFGG